ncbi:hypothetical protein [Flavobacterium degerlachei]|jgi:hypothetical protein|uniref:hypothetical protein n=1 Tax=Flavobacterium degerlachei TaxID=229203 RepID=UPI000B833320|nr:hypothetical protein [Flavobacterium degerlachei]
MSKSYIKCLECNTVNTDSDYCSNCGAIINIVLKRQLEREKKLQVKIEKQKTIEPSRVDVFLKKGKNHSNIIIRAIFQVSYLIWVFFSMLIGFLISIVVAAAAG